jgi:hypothetical protein
MEAYQIYKCEDCVAHILMLSSMRNDIMLCFKKHHSTQVVWYCEDLVWENLHY